MGNKELVDFWRITMKILGLFTGQGEVWERLHEGVWENDEVVTDDPESQG